MKRVILLTLTALLLISSMTACGSKKSDSTDKGSESRVLYPDDDTSEENEVDKSEADESSEDEESKSEETDTVNEESETSSENSNDDEKSTENDSSSKTTSSKKSITTTSSQTSSASNSSNTNSQNNSSKQESSQPNNDTTDSDISADTDTEQEVIGSFDESDFVVNFYGYEINFGDNIEDVIAILGDHDLIEAPSCKYEGQSDKTFIFEECEINTYPNEDGSIDYVVGIVITDSNFETAKGARIGTTSEELIRLYGYSESDNSPMRRYTIGDKILSFYVEDDVVTEINYIWNN